MRRELMLCVLVSATLVPLTGGTAYAQKSADRAAADILFSEGKKLIAAGDTEAACAKFEASLARLSQVGTQLALGSCYEKLGKTASAWAEFRAAARAAARARDAQRHQFAEDRAAALESRLSRLVIKLEPGYRVDGLVVRRDSIEITAAELATPVPVDPGEHTVEAEAPGWNKWSNTVTIADLPGVVEVIVPALGKNPTKLDELDPVVAPSRSLPRAYESDDPGRSRRHLAYGVAGGGVALLGSSLLFGMVARSRWSAAKPHCRDGVCDQTGVDLADGARGMGNLSTAAVLVGAVATAAGIGLYVTAPRASQEEKGATALRVVPDVGGAHVGLAIEGGF